MWSAAAVLVCALTVLGRSERTMPRIELVDKAPIESSSRLVEAFVRPPERTIYLVTNSVVFRDAQRSRDECGHSIAIKKLASILAHEEWHILNGADERGAYEAQLSTLIRLNVSPGSGLYGSVLKAMTVATKKPRKPDMVLAGRPEQPLITIGP